MARYGQKFMDRAVARLRSNSKRAMLEKVGLPNKSEAYSPIELVALCRIAQAR